MPAAAKAHTVAGGAAFIEHFFATVNKAHTTPQAGLIPALSGPQCSACKGLEKITADLVVNHWHYSGNPVAVSKIDLVVAAAPRMRFTFTMTQSGVPLLDRAGKVVSTYKRETTGRVALLVWDRGRWFMWGIG